jgi:CRP-like cAMP-binding protein
MNLFTLVHNAPAEIKETFIKRKHAKNTQILYAGEDTEYLYILTEGSAEVIFQNYDGAMYTMYHYEAYSLFGELEIFNEKAKTFDVICRTPCTTLAISKYNVHRWMRMDFEFTTWLIEQLTNKLLASARSLSILSLLKVNDRLLNCVYTHSRVGDLDSLTKEDICIEINTPIRSLNRAIQQCRDMGLIDYQNKKFLILDLERLEEHCYNLVE